MAPPVPKNIKGLAPGEVLRDAGLAKTATKRGRGRLPVPKVTVRCNNTQCKKAYKVTEKRREKTKFCSIPCASAVRTILRICPECDLPKVRGRDTYCGQPCYQAARARKREEHNANATGGAEDRDRPDQRRAG